MTLQANLNAKWNGEEGINETPNCECCCIISVAAGKDVLKEEYSVYTSRDNLILILHSFQIPCIFIHRFIHSSFSTVSSLLLLVLCAISKRLKDINTLRVFSPKDTFVHFIPKMISLHFNSFPSLSLSLLHFRSLVFLCIFALLARNLTWNTHRFTHWIAVWGALFLPSEAHHHSFVRRCILSSSSLLHIPFCYFHFVALSFLVQGIRRFFLLLCLESSIFCLDWYTSVQIQMENFVRMSYMHAWLRCCAEDSEMKILGWRFWVEDSGLTIRENVVRKQSFDHLLRDTKYSVDASHLISNSPFSSILFFFNPRQSFCPCWPACIKSSWTSLQVFARETVNGNTLKCTL